MPVVVSKELTVSAALANQGLVQRKAIAHAWMACIPAAATAMTARLASLEVPEVGCCLFMF